MYEQDWLRIYSFTSAFCFFVLCVSLVFPRLVIVWYFVARESLLFYLHGLLREVALRSKHYRRAINRIGVRIKCRQACIASSALMLSSAFLPLGWPKFMATNISAVVFYVVWSIMSFDSLIGVRPMELVRTRPRVHERTGLRVAASVGYVLSAFASEIHYHGMLDRYAYSMSTSIQDTAVYFHCLVGIGLLYQVRSEIQTLYAHIPGTLKRGLINSSGYLRSLALLIIRLNTLLLFAHKGKAQLALTGVATGLIGFSYVTSRTSKRWFEEGSPERYAVALFMCAAIGSYQHSKRFDDAPEDVVGFTSGLLAEIPETFILYVVSGIL